MLTFELFILVIIFINAFIKIIKYIFYYMSNIYDYIMKTIKSTSFYKIFYNKTLNCKYEVIRKINKIIIIY
jgi:hypothetical protein